MVVSLSPNHYAHGSVKGRTEAHAAVSNEAETVPELN